jgi:putative inorganic carbon (HCO3(-)) transporter
MLCLAMLLVWLAVLPLPFGSVVERARVPLIAVPIALCIVSTLLRLYVVRNRASISQPTRPWLIWAGGCALFLVVGAMQLVPLPPSLLRAVSPESHAIWSAASRVAELAGVHVGSHPISIDPDATLFELFRIAALFAAFSASGLLVRTPARRLTLAAVICLAAFFEAMYGVREAALQRYQIWGWTNKLIFNRVTGTFVNPNHFAHYMAIALPMALFVAAVAWYRAGKPDTPLRQRLVALIEKQALWTALALIAAVVAVMAILLAQSRGALLALTSGLLIIASCLPGRRLPRAALGAAAGLLLVAVLGFFLGTERTSLFRFLHSSLGGPTLGGRRIGIDAAVLLWQRFPILGSGLGTFERAVFMAQREDLEKTYHHAHNDYAEIAATAGTIGYLIAIVTLFGGYFALMRMTFGRAGAELSWLRRAFQAAALASLTIAMVHALVDFNFFIPANPATLAVIAGAAVAVVDHDKRTRR